MTNFDREIPFDDLPLLPPELVELETRNILLKTITASSALAKLNGAMTSLPNPRLFLDTIHLQAKASSEIENIITTNDDLYKAVGAT